MDAGMTDVFQIVEYSRDKRTIDTTVPRALLVCLLGLVLLGLDPNPPHHSFLGGFVLMLGLGASLGFFLFALMQALHGRTPATRILGILLLVIYVIILAVSYWGRPGDFFKLPYSRVLGNEPPGNVGWMAIIGSVGWIVFVLYRHFRPATPLLALSPAGISYRANGIKNLLVPWHEIQGIGDYELNLAGVSQRAPHLTAVLVSKEFYERNILPQRSVWDGRDRNWELSFHPKGPHVQIQLSGAWFSIDPKDIRAPIEARWKAFRDTPLSSSSVPSVTPRGAPRGEPLVYGRWSIDGSLWQAVKFLVPLACIAAVLVWMGA